jgi:hypothetical protein
VLLSCLGYLFESPLLLSSQALIAILGGFLWLVNYSSGLILGHPIFAGMEYMWDVNLPRWVRSLSLYHVALPVLLLAGLHHFGYDRRAWKLQGLISLLVICLSRLSSPAKNINFAFSDPLLQRAWGPAPVHVMVIWSGLMLLIYWPTHKVLSHVFLEPRELKC